jgi:hypothetical protein
VNLNPKKTLKIIQRQVNLNPKKTLKIIQRQVNLNPKNPKNYTETSETDFVGGFLYDLKT